MPQHGHIQAALTTHKPAFPEQLTFSSHLLNTYCLLGMVPRAGDSDNWQTSLPPLSWQGIYSHTFPVSWVLLDECQLDAELSRAVGAECAGGSSCPPTEALCPPHARRAPRGGASRACSGPTVLLLLGEQMLTSPATKGMPRGSEIQLRAGARPSPLNLGILGESPLLTTRSRAREKLGPPDVWIHPTEAEWGRGCSSGAECLPSMC